MPPALTQYGEREATVTESTDHGAKRGRMSRRARSGAALLAALAATAVGMLALSSSAMAAPLGPDTLLTSSSVSDPTAARTASFAWTASEADATFECSFDGAPFAACLTSKTFNGLPVGEHTFQVRASKGGHTDVTPASVTWTIEPAPNTIIFASPPASTTDRFADFAWSSDLLGATFECALDGSGYAPCSSPRRYSGLGPGTHLFFVRAIKNGLTDPSPAARQWTIEGPADTDITAQPPAITASRSATLVFNANKPLTTFECAFDSNTYSPCSSPRAYNGLTIGTHTFKVRAVRFGLVDATPAVATWTIEGTPETTLTSVPAAVTPLRDAPLAWSSNLAAATFECALDAAPFAPCSSPRTYTSLTLGTHTFKVRASKNGLTDATPATVTWKVEGTPQTTITAQPAAIVGTGSASLAWGADLAFSTFECSLDGSPFAPCSSPRTYNGLGFGTHTFDVRASKWGFTDATPARATWTIEGTPQTTITALPPAANGASSATLAWASNFSFSTFECSLDGSPFAPCSSPRTYSGLAFGPHTFQVRASKWGRTDATPAVASWVQEGTPQTTISAAPTAITLSRSATFAWGADLAFSTFECALDGSAFAPCSSPRTYNALSYGPHTFQVRASKWGRTDATPASLTWRVDPPEPTTTLLTMPTASTYAATASFTFASDQATAIFQCSTNNGPFSNCTSPFLFNGLAPGSYLFAVRAVNTVGVVDATPASWLWTVLSPVPQTSLTTSLSGVTTSRSADFAFTSDIPFSTFECSLDGAPFAPCSPPKLFNGLALGQHVFRVRAVNGAFADPTPAQFVWTVIP